MLRPEMIFHCNFCEQCFGAGGTLPYFLKAMNGELVVCQITELVCALARSVRVEKPRFRNIYKSKTMLTCP